MARLGAVPAALATSAIGYYLAYRSIYAAEGGYALTHRQLTTLVRRVQRIVRHRWIRPDGLVLQASGASRREAIVRVTAQAGMEQAMLAAYGCAASIVWLGLGRAGVPADVTLPWAVIPAPAFAAAFWLATRPGRRARLAVVLDAVLLIRALFVHPVRHRGAIAGMALFWAGDALAAWSALAAFGFVMTGAALLVGYCTGMVFTRRVAPLAGAGTLTLILPLTIWASGAPLATAITGVAACRQLGALSLPPALASLPVLRETTRQAAITTHAVPDTATRPCAAARDITAPAGCARSGLVARDGTPSLPPCNGHEPATSEHPSHSNESAPGRPTGGRDPVELPGRAGRQGPADHDGRIGGAERPLEPGS